MDKKINKKTLKKNSEFSREVSHIYLATSKCTLHVESAKILIFQNMIE